jgi:hypothetical protein
VVVEAGRQVGGGAQLGERALEERQGPSADGGQPCRVDVPLPAAQVELELARVQVVGDREAAGIGADRLGGERRCSNG